MQATLRHVTNSRYRYDTEPSFLEHTFEDREPSEPSLRKAKLSDSADGFTTISGNLNSGAYGSLAKLRQDAHFVSEQLVTIIRAKDKQKEGPNSGRPSVEDLKQIKRINALEQLVTEIVDKESRIDTPQKPKGIKQEHGSLANGVSADAQAGAGGRSGTVLTLFGNAPTPKQLFSSMQNPPAGMKDSYIKTELPVEEMGLPNGLSATKIMPTATEDMKKGPTFAEAFAPPYNLPQLHPPKAHKRSVTRDATINWEFKDSTSRGSKRGGWTTQTQTVGDWLGWGGVDKDRDATQEKRKQRDRALSSGEKDVQVPDKVSLETQLEREEEALFRRAFSSFAPTCDNTRSLVPAEIKSMVWWNKVGSKRFDEVFGGDVAVGAKQPYVPAIDPALLDEEPAESAMDEEFGKVIEDLDELQQEPDEFKRSRTDPEQVLREISELLETLASHQRIRNSSLTPATSTSKVAMSPAPLLASKLGKPDSPGDEEVSTYNKLRHEIAYLVMQLPPYAVAKLNGEQLDELGVSKLVTFEAKDFKGTMEEDQVARLAKYTAAATAAGIASLTRPGSSTSNQHYSTTSQRTPAIGANANTRYAQTSQYPSSRTPATAPQYQRSTSNQSTYGTPTAPPQRNYAQPAQPAQQYNRPAAPQYPQTNSQYYQQQTGRTPANYSGGYNPAYSQATPSTQPRPTSTNYSGSAPLQQFQQRANNATSYQSNTATSTQAQSPFNRTASPAKPQGYTQPPLQPGTQPRPNYQQSSQISQQLSQQPPGSGRATPVYPSQPQTPVNGFQPPRPPSTQPLVPRAASGTPQPPVPIAIPPHQTVNPQQIQANGHS